MAEPQVTNLEQKYIDELKVLINADEKGAAIFDKHNRFLEIAKYALDKNVMSQEIKNYCIKEIIQSVSGFRFSRFEDYYRVLLVITPELMPILKSIDSYIQNDLKLHLTDAEIFSQDKLADVGHVLFDKIACSVSGATPDLIKIVIKDLQSRPPIRNTKVPVTDEDYYETLCIFWRITELPKTVYEQAISLFQDVFRNRYPKLISKIRALIQDVETERQQIEAQKKKIIDNLKAEKFLKRDIRKAKERLVEYDFKLKELKALYVRKDMPDGTKTCLGMLEYYKKRVPVFFQTFCEDITDEAKVDEKLKSLAMKCIHSQLHEENALDALAFSFLPYRRNMRILEFLVSGDCYTTLYNLFFKVKFNPFYLKIANEYAAKAGSGEEDEEQFKADVETHPMNPRTLSSYVVGKDYASYLSTLELYCGEAISNIRSIIQKSACLQKRKILIEEGLSLIENQKNEVAVNLLPIQMEGLYFDLLEYSTICECVEDMERFDTFLKQELVEKIQFGTDIGLNINFDAYAYFKYYFNSVIRNTIAHGNYATLVHGRGHSEAGASVTSNNLLRVIALELLFDLNALVLLISHINEIDTAAKYIKDMAIELKPKPGTKIEWVYDRLCDDLTAMMSRVNFTDYKAGTFVKFEPRQILAWVFNPTYEDYIEKDSLVTVRNTLTTTAFWEYFLKADGSKLTKYMKNRLNNLQSVVQSLFQLDLKDTEKTMLIDVNKRLANLLKT